jgi:hypothetical protein
MAAISPALDSSIGIVVCIPSFRRPQHLRLTLQSLAADTGGTPLYFHADHGSVLIVLRAYYEYLGNPPLELGQYVNAGSLLVDGSIGTGLTTVNLGGLLGGRGLIGGSVSNGGIVSPGNTLGTLRINGNYTQGAGGTSRHFAPLRNLAHNGLRWAQPKRDVPQLDVAGAFAPFPGPMISRTVPSGQWKCCQLTPSAC